MKRKLAFILTILFLAGLVLAADSPYARRIRPGAAGTCIENEITYDMTLHKLYICLNTGYSEVALGGSIPPTDATYITQTANVGLSAEQALSSLSTGIMRVATTTGVITSLTDSAGIAANISNETGTGVMVFGTLPNFTTGISIGTNPAATGEIRLPNNTSIIFRNQANSADFVGLSINTSNAIVVGNNGTILALAGGLWQINNSTGALTAIGAYPITTTGAGSFSNYLTATNCNDSAGAAACGSASAGAFVMDAAATTVTVSTTAVTANSEIVIQEAPALNTRLSVTCNTTTGRNFTVTTLTAGTSFVVTSSAAPVTNPACLWYTVRN